jgi:hypothetical protein
MSSGTRYVPSFSLVPKFQLGNSVSEALAFRLDTLRCYLGSRCRDACLNRGLAPEGELLSFAPPRQLLLRCSTSCIHAVEKKVAKEKAARCRFAPALLAFVEGQQKGAPAPLPTCGLPAAPLTGNFSTKAPVLGAANGTPSVP